MNLTSEIGTPKYMRQKSSNIRANKRVLYYSCDGDGDDGENYIVATTKEASKSYSMDDETYI